MVGERHYSKDKHGEGNIATLREGDISSVITSPPYADQSIIAFTNDKERTKEMRRQLQEKGYIEWDGKHYTETEWRALNHGRIDGRTTRGAKKGKTGYSAVITSPTYSDISAGAGGSNTKPPKHGRGQSGRNPKAASQDIDKKYGKSGGQIARLKEGNVDGVLTSPPYEGLADAKKNTNTNDAARGYKTKPIAYSRDAENIGNKKGETYWEAMAKVYAECRKVLKPGGIIVIVVKDFVRNEQRVPLCDNTVKLLEHIGFTMEYRVRAWLIEPGHDDMFTGKHKNVQRKSFFRRLHEKRYPELSINFEEVLICKKLGPVKITGERV